MKQINKQVHNIIWKLNLCVWDAILVPKKETIFILSKSKKYYVCDCVLPMFTHKRWPIWTKVLFIYLFLFLIPFIYFSRGLSKYALNKSEMLKERAWKFENALGKSVAESNSEQYGSNEREIYGIVHILTCHLLRTLWKLSSLFDFFI